MFFLYFSFWFHIIIIRGNWIKVYNFSRFPHAPNMLCVFVYFWNYFLLHLLIDSKRWTREPIHNSVGITLSTVCVQSWMYSWNQDRRKTTNIYNSSAFQTMFVQLFRNVHHFLCFIHWIYLQYLPLFVQGKTLLGDWLIGESWIHYLVFF